MGLRLGEALALTVADIDRANQRVHIRQGKGNKDRFVPLPEPTLKALADFGVSTVTLFVIPRRQTALHQQPVDGSGRHSNDHSPGRQRGRYFQAGPCPYFAA